MRAYAFYCAILIYAVFSSPTPDHFGTTEIVIAALLIFAVHPVRLFGTLTHKNLPSPLSYHRIFVLWMLSTPFMIGVLNGHETHDIIRDIIPLFYLLLPFAFMHSDLKHLSTVMMIAGACFAARYCLIAVPQHLMIGVESGTDSLLYLANAPLVIFAAIYGFHIVTHPTRIFLTQRIAGLCITLITLLAMATMVQRAPLALCLLGMTAIIAVRFFRAPIFIACLVVLFGIAIAPITPLILQIIDGFITKTMTVGANSRIEEFTAILHHLSIWGHGWGAEWQSPAVGDYWVRYTHNMVSYYGLKAGVLGLFFATGFMMIWLTSAYRVMRHHDFAIGIALFISLFIHMILYTGYKTFDFALLIMMTYIWIKDRPVFLSSTEPSRPPLGQRDGSRAILPSTSAPKGTPSPL